jgi:hypothetical protein
MRTICISMGAGIACSLAVPLIAGADDRTGATRRPSAFGQLFDLGPACAATVAGGALDPPIGPRPDVRVTTAQSTEVRVGHAGQTWRDLAPARDTSANGWMHGGLTRRETRWYGFGSDFGCGGPQTPWSTLPTAEFDSFADFAPEAAHFDILFDVLAAYAAGGWESERVGQVHAMHDASVFVILGRDLQRGSGGGPYLRSRWYQLGRSNPRGHVLHVHGHGHRMPRRRY